ncbi:16 kDa phloem protein 2-like [Hibiscus syriacus]|uniref:16 kDa phloem protein 2-like n=1 Tax=Hibiscus syriacus TaxID=106335 RepID=UPI0019238D62|nr:16 kDa phloem protein 2-like [Hibiscus syriacus]
MPHGTLQVVLVSAKGLENTDFLCNMDPYVLLTCRTQEQKSSVASGKGSEPEWNENFEFNISEGVSELKVKILVFNPSFCSSN